MLKAKYIYTVFVEIQEGICGKNKNVSFGQCFHIRGQKIPDEKQINKEKSNLKNISYQSNQLKSSSRVN